MLTTRLYSFCWSEIWPYLIFLCSLTRWAVEGSTNLRADGDIDKFLLLSERSLYESSWGSAAAAKIFFLFTYLSMESIDLMLWFRRTWACSRTSSSSWLCLADSILGRMALFLSCSAFTDIEGFNCLGCCLFLLSSTPPPLWDFSGISDEMLSLRCMVGLSVVSTSVPPPGCISLSGLVGIRVVGFRTFRLVVWVSITVASTS